MPTPLDAGVVGWASRSHPEFFDPEKSRPIVLIGRNGAGRMLVGWVSHTWYFHDKVVPLDRTNAREAYDPPSPFVSERHALVLYAGPKFMVMEADIIDDHLEVGRTSSVRIEVTRRVQLPPATWNPLRLAIHRTAGWIKS